MSSIPTNGEFSKMIEYLALAMFVGALLIYAYMLLDPFQTEQDIPPSLTLVVGFGVAFVRDYLTEKRMAARLDRTEAVIFEQARRAEEMKVATRTERNGE